VKLDRLIIEKAWKSITVLEQSVRSIDEFLGQASSNESVNAIFFPVGVKLLLSRKVAVSGIVPSVYTLIYDVYPLLLLESGIIRGVRYIGETYKNMPATGVLNIKKLERGTGGGQGLSTTFITRGMFSRKTKLEKVEIVASIILSHVAKLLGYKIFQKTGDRTFKSTVLIPSPSSCITTVSWGKSITLTPFIGYALLDFSQVKKTKGFLLGYSGVDYYEFKANLVLCNPSGDERGRFLHLTTQFPAVMPVHEALIGNTALDALINREKIIIEVMGIAEMPEGVLGDSRLQKKNYGKGKIIIFGETPLDPRISAIICLGKLVYEPLYLGKGFESIKVPLKIAAPFNLLKRVYEEFGRLLKHVQQDLKVENQISLQSIFQSFLKDQSSEWFDFEDKCYLKAPLLVSIEAFRSLNPYPLLNIIREMQGREDVTKILELLRLERNHYMLSLKKLNHLLPFLKAWSKAIESRNEIIYNYGFIPNL